VRWRVGTSGYAYDAWAGSFYPEDLPRARRLAFYAERLPAVEINNTFYRMPREALLAGWAVQVPDAFRFALKAPRRISHGKADEGAGAAEALAHLFRVGGALGSRLGPVLLQLPPWARKNLDRLRTLLGAVPPGGRLVLEVRHRSWLDEAVFAALREAGAALCASDFDDPERAVPVVPTAPFGYLRLRAADYGDAALRRWAGAIAAQPWEEAYVFFKHEDAGAAPRLAARLLALASALGPRRVPSSGAPPAPAGRRT